MLDTCRITIPGAGTRTFNEATGQYTEPARVTIYEGKCRVQVKVDVNSNVVEANVVEREWTYVTANLQLPVTAVTGSIPVDAIAEILTAHDDQALVGRLYNLQGGSFHKSHSVYRRIRVKELRA